MSKASKFIWCEPGTSGRNDYVLFRHHFTLANQPKRAFLHLFADTRYRLTINGQQVGHGPARFKRPFPEYDSHDVKDFLVKGKNSIAILVCSLEIGTFLSDPGPGGLIAWGEVTDMKGKKVTFQTDSSWKAKRSPAHESLTPELSFAVGPGEECDLRKWPVGWEEPGFDDSQWPTARELETASWGKLTKRSIPALDERFVAIDHCQATYTLAAEPDLEVQGAKVPGPRRSQGWAVLASWIQSPKNQTVEVIASGGAMMINGQTPKRHPHSQAPYRSSAPVKFKKGWNLCLVFNSYRADLFEMGIAVPKQAGLQFRQTPKDRGKRGWLLAGPVEEPVEAAEKLFRNHKSLDSLPDLSAPWKPLPSKWTGLTPMLERSWSVLEREPHLPESGVIENPALCDAHTQSQGYALLFDFAGEVLGRPTLDFTAPAGVIIDLAYTERIHHGRAEPWYQGTRMLERFISRGGRQTIQTMHPRGMRYLEVTFRQPKKGIVLHRVGVTRALYPVESTGQFECSDPRLNRIWELGRITQAVCMEDAYLDCPWRERGIYTGDILVQYATNLACFGDHALMQRSTDLLLQTQDETGLLAPCSHGLHNGKHPDYTAIAVRCVREHWARTGDLRFVRKSKRRILKILDGLRSMRQDGSILVDGDGYQPYIDSGLNLKQGASCGLNCIVQGAFSDAAFLMALLDDVPRAVALEAEAEEIAEAIRATFLDPKTNTFLDLPVAGARENQASAVGNTLALINDLVESREEPLQVVLEAMTNNFPDGAPRRREYNISPYFSYYVLDLCRREGRTEEAAAYIRRYWSHMLDHGAWTTWEFFSPICSLCHAWSTSPTHHMTNQILGVWYAVDGNPQVVRVHPNPPADIQWASGVFPHPDGPIEIYWEREGDAIRLEYSAPSTVEIITP